MAGQQLVLDQPVDHVGPPGRRITATGPAPLVPLIARRLELGGVEALALGVRAAVDERRQQEQLPGAPVGRPGRGSTSSTGRSCSTTDAVGPRTVVIHSASSSALDTVADRHTSRTSGRQVDDDLLPHRSAVGVLEVVDLVEHHVLQAVERREPA